METNFEKREGWPGNGGGGWEISASLLELTGLCKKIIGREGPIAAATENRQADPRIFPADSSKLFARTNWRPRRGVEKIVAGVSVRVRANEKELPPLV